MIVRKALPADREAIWKLLPRLADFDIPARRHPEDLWRGDRELLKTWLDGGEPNGFAYVAESESGEVVGIVYVRLGKEILSGWSNAHLEVLAVARHAEGQGIASRLVGVAQDEAHSNGARTLTLNVFAANRRARGFYERLGFDEELIRCIRELD